MKHCFLKYEVLVMSLKPDSEEERIRMSKYACKDNHSLDISFLSLYTFCVGGISRESKLIMFGINYGNSCLSNLFRKMQVPIVVFFFRVMGSLETSSSHLDLPSSL